MQRSPAVETAQPRGETSPIQQSGDRERSDGVQAVRRAISILKAFEADLPEMGIAELSRHLGLNRTTVHRLVGALVSEGLIAHDAATGKYRLGPELAVLGLLAWRNADLRRLALPHLQALARRTGETVDLEILSGGDVVVVEEVPGDYVLSAARHIGKRYPAHCTSTGKVLLAYLPPAQLQHSLEGPLVAATPRSLTRVEDIRREIARAREQGFALSVEELEEDLIAVGAPIFDGRGQAVASVSVSGPRSRVTSRRVPELVDAVRAAAADISRELGRR